MTELVLVKAAECRPLRRSVLGLGTGDDDASLPGDDDPRALHLAVKKGKRVLGVLSMVHDVRAGVGSEVWCVRAVAVADGARRQGVGRQLLLAAQAVAAKRGGGMWSRVDPSAVPYFAAHGFRPAGDGTAPGGDPVLMTWKGKP